MKIIYENGWSKETILAWLQARPSRKQVLHDPNGYTIRFSDGSTWAQEYGDWHTRTPAKSFINGSIAQISYDS